MNILDGSWVPEFLQLEVKNEGEGGFCTGQETPRITKTRFRRAFELVLLELFSARTEETFLL